MKRSNTGFGVNLRSLVVVMVVMTLGFSLMPTYRAEANWNGASFLGGMVAGHMVSRIGYNMRARTAAAEYAAYARPQADASTVVYHQAPAAVPAPAAQMTPEQKLNQLDKLAAGGYITPAEYKARRQAILDTM